MKDSLFIILKDFLKCHYLPGRPVLIGLSGGVDSLALFHLLLEVKPIFSFELHAAHIDHGWREESANEAKELSQMANTLNIPFHLHTLTPPSDSKNLEEKARIERLHFFQKIYKKINAQALILAHHFDDQAETILKRVFEGSSLLSLGGMKSISSMNGMFLWRPLLSIHKEDLKNFLQKKELIPFEDRTNEDTKFLRSRMRKEIFPYLGTLFGKEVKNNLYQLGETAKELKEYLDKKISPFLNSLKEGPFGVYLDFTPFYPLERIELKAVLKVLFESKKILLSQPSLQTLVNLLEKRASNRKMVFNKTILYIDRGVLFFLEKTPPHFSFKGKLANSSFVNDKWEWNINILPSSKIKNGGWKEFWLGEISVFLKKGDYEILPPIANVPFPGNTPIKKWWGEHKVPAFLRQSLPLLAQNNVITHEFFTGKSKEKEIEEGVVINIKIKNREDKL